MEDGSPIAQGFTEGIRQVQVFEIHEGDLEAELQALRDGDRQAVVVLRPDFGASVAAGQAGDIDVYHDPSQTTVVQVLMPIVRKVVTEVERGITGTPSLVNLNEKTIQARDLRYIDFFVPGVLAMALMQLGIFSAIPLVIQRQNRILKRMGATPLRRSTIVASSVFFRLIIAVAQAFIIILVGRLVFDVHMEGNWFYLTGMVLLGATTFVSMGYLIASFARTEESATPLLMAIQFPMMFLGGVFFPVEAMPDFLEPIVKAIPLTYLGDSLRQIMVDSAALNSQLLNISVLAGWLVGCLALAVRFFRWE
jgi:ABC-2 type transport system permease protein